MDFKLQMARLLAILGVHLSIFFSMWPSFVMCITMVYLWFICFMFGGGVGFGLFFCFVFVISICTELLCFRRGI